MEIVKSAKATTSPGSFIGSDVATRAYRSEFLFADDDELGW